MDNLTMIEELKNKVEREMEEWKNKYFLPYLNKYQDSDYYDNLFEEYVLRNYTVKLIKRMTVNDWLGGVYSLGKKEVFSSLSEDISDGLKMVEDAMPAYLCGRPFPYKTIKNLLDSRINALDILTREGNIQIVSIIQTGNFDYDTFSIFESIMLKEEEKKNLEQKSSN